MIVAESANLAKGNFLATLSHEFRTPLNAMLGYLELLGLDGPLSVAQAGRVDRVKAGIWHLNSMIDEILSFAKHSEGRSAIVLEQLDAREIVAEARSLVEPQATAKGLAFAMDLPIEVVELATDRGKLRQIIINLCGNAVKYTAAGEIRLGLRGDSERIVFEVHDTGIGVAPENQARIFDRFWQVDGAATRAFDGMGIGLAAAREAARLLGGDVEVESQLGVGSTFRLWLPRDRNS
jgi:signal transduction histidine kinase